MISGAPAIIETNNAMTDPKPWWHPDRHADRRPGLIARGRIKSAIRAWFEQQDFTEVEAGALVVSPGNETHLQAFATEIRSPGGARRPMYLHTSPEFAAKKLLAAGETKIFTFAPVYRNGESGPLHAAEFTMLEWYRAEPGSDNYAKVQRDCTELVSVAAGVSGRTEWRWNDRVCEVIPPSTTKTVAELCAELFGFDLRASLKTPMPNRNALAAAARKVDIESAADETWGDIFSKLMVEAERRYGELPALTTAEGKERPLILDHYPACMSPLARPLAIDPTVAGRFELFVAGIELANGFAENNDARSVRAGLSLEMEEKQRLYYERYPLDEDFLEALPMLPDETAGCAMGFDRLVMLSTGATHIDQVIWTPLPR